MEVVKRGSLTLLHLSIASAFSQMKVHSGVRRETVLNRQLVSFIFNGNGIGFGGDSVRKTLVYSLAAISLLLIAMIAVVPSSAADYTKVGVKAGDTAHYTLEVTNFTAGMTMSVYVKNVTGVMVGVNLTILNPDSSLNDTEMMLGNITDGSGFLFPFYPLVASNLKQGDLIYDHPGNPAINETIPVNIAGYSRTVNFVNLTSDPANYMRIWWDQPTGLVVQIRMLLSDMGMGSINATLTSTTAFTTSGGAPPYDITTMVIVIALVIIVVAGAAAGVHRRGKSTI
ncbi:MAG: hypothetical protein WED05_10235 [Candidatus Atabeyarchaeum deiterrae]